MGNLEREMLGHHAFIDDSLYPRMTEELMQFRGDQHEVGAAVICKRPDTKHVARTEERVVSRVPNCEHKISQHVDWRILPPTQIRFQDKLSVTVIPKLDTLGYKDFAQVIAVIDAAVEYYMELAGFIAQRLVLPQPFQRRVERTMA